MKKIKIEETKIKKSKNKIIIIKKKMMNMQIMTEWNND